MDNAQKIHEARTLRAQKNIKKALLLRKKYGLVYTLQEQSLVKDLYPGTYEEMKRLNQV